MFTYIYYSIYKFVLITPSKNEMPQHLANTTQVLVWSFNIDFFLRILEAYEIINLSYILDSKINYVILFIFLLILGYFIFIKGGKYLKIKEKYDKESKITRIIKMSFVLIYVLLSFILPISL